MFAEDGDRPKEALQSTVYAKRLAHFSFIMTGRKIHQDPVTHVHSSLNLSFFGM